MKFIIFSKKGTRKAGELRSGDFKDGCFLDIRYGSNKDFFMELQELLLKYYNLKPFSQRNPTGKMWHNKIVNGDSENV